jgi:hypothetical protein
MGENLSLCAGHASGDIVGDGVSCGDPSQGIATTFCVHEQGSRVVAQRLTQEG